MSPLHGGLKPNKVHPNLLDLVSTLTQRREGNHDSPALFGADNLNHFVAG